MSHKRGPLIQDRKFDDTFWKEQYPKLQRYCRFLAQNPWDGDDIAQETYIKALKYSPQQQNMSSSLLNKIAYHHWIDLLRKRKNETVQAAPEEKEAVHHPMEEITAAVERLLKQLTPKQAVILLLKEAFQYQIKEIADMLKTSEMAVKSVLHRAKNRLEKENGADVFWNEAEREQLSELFYEALKSQDPTVLIQNLPSIAGVNKFPKIPSSTLCMAA